MVVVNDATVKGGSYYPLTVRCPSSSWALEEVDIVTCRLRNTSGHRRLLASMVFLAFTLVSNPGSFPKVLTIEFCEIVESGGAALPHQANVFPDKEHFGRIFYNMV